MFGNLKNRYNELYGIKIRNKADKCLEIYISHNKEEFYAKNWMKIYHNIEKLSESWKRGKLTLLGKSCIVKT